MGLQLPSFTPEVSLRSSKPVPILLTVRELDHGGIERDVTKIAIQLDRSRFEPHVACYQAQGMRFDELVRAGVPILHLPLFSLKSTTALRSAMQLRRYIRQHGIRLVHAYDTSAVFVVPIARALGVPAVLSSTLGHRDLTSRRTHRQLRWTDKWVDAVVVNCDAMRRHMVDDERFPSGRVEICYNGVDTRQFFPDAAPAAGLMADASLVIGSVSVLRPEKSLDLLQLAFARVQHLQPRMKLLFVGSGPELSRLQENSKTLGIQEDCVFVPATPSVPQFLRMLDIFVSCSRSEAFSNSVLEAMACGCSVIGSAIGGTPELIGNDERGLLFRSGDAGDLAEKLAMLIGDEKLRRRFGLSAAHFAKTALNMEVAGDRMAQIYEMLLRRKFPLQRCQ